MLLAPVEEKQGTTTIDPLSGKLTSRPTILSTPVRFFFPLSFSFLRAARRKHIDREGNDPQVQRFRFENIHGRIFCDCVQNEIWHVVKFLN